MAKFENGVKYYTEGIASVTVHFPQDEVSCNWCPFCRAEGDLKRFWCRLTNTMIYNPYSGIMDDCPIKFKGGE